MSDESGRVVSVAVKFHSLSVDVAKKINDKLQLSSAKGYFGAHPKSFVVPASILALTFVSQGPFFMYMQLYLMAKGATPFIISLAISLSGLGVFLGSSLWGAASVRFSRRVLLAISLLSDGLLLAALSLSLPIELMLGAMLLRSLAVSALIPLTTAAVSEETDPTTRGRSVAFMTSARAFGWIIGSSVGGLLLDSLGIRHALRVMAVLPIVSAVLTIALVNNSRHPDAKQPRVRTRQLIYPLYSLYLATVFRQIGLTGAIALICVYFSSFGVSAASMGLAQALNPMMQLVGLFLTGRIVDRIGRRPIFRLGFGISCLVPLAFLLSRSVIAFALGWMLIGLSFSLMYVGTTAHIGDKIARSHQSIAFGVFESSRGLGTILGPLLAGFLANSVGMKTMLLVMFAITILGFLMSSSKVFNKREFNQ